MNGEYALGERLIETNLAGRFNVSRHVVREALQMLEGEELVSSDAFRGRTVFQPEPKEIEGLLLVRINMEALASALAAYRVTIDGQRQLRDLARLPPEGFADLVEADEWDLAIHRYIWKIADEPVLSDYLHRIICPFMTVANSALRKGEFDPVELRREAEIQEQPDDPRSHTPLVEAICAQDPGGASRAAIRHLSFVGKISKELQDVLIAALGTVR